MLKLNFKPKYGILWRDIAPQTRGFLGIGCATYKRGTLVSAFPVVGVRFDEVYAIQRRLSAVPESKTNSTLYTPLRYLVPELPDYDFELGVDPHDEIERLASHVQHHALPFYDAHADIDRALASLSTPLYKDLSGVSEFVPAVQFMRGDWSVAVESAERYVSTMDTTRGNGKDYKRFVEALRAAVADTTAPCVL